jgi:L-lysine exporter family protein LysE/ArgO|tara:strand:+ start:5543 stop:6157 length:615 start_codon:yes stop_codon:yes gene_type:complete
MNFLALGFFTGLSLIFAIGAQNIFVMEQGLKKQYIFIVCLICSISDLILIFFGIFLFEYFKVFFTQIVELIFNILLFIFLLYFIYNKIISLYKISYLNFGSEILSLKNIIIKTLGFTYLNPHVYSDTVFFLGNFSKNLLINNKILFGIGAAIASFLFFFSLGYLAKFFSNYLIDSKTWKTINFFIIIFMTVLSSYVFLDIIDLV